MKMRKQNLITPVILSALIPSLLLSGCGGGDGNSASNGSNVPATGPVVEQAPVSARDGFNVVAPDTPGYIDLSSLIESGTAGAKITSVYLESSQGFGDCGQVYSSTDASDSTNVILGQGFNVTIDGAAICEYGYEVESVALAGQTKTRARAKVMVASSAGGSAVLPPISIAMAINDVNVTDVEDALGTVDFPDGYTLSEDFSVLGDGDVTVDVPSFSISYTATAEGVFRVVYALEGEIAGVPDIKMGTLDYAVSDSLNNAPTAENFSYGTDIQIGTSVDIDVSDYIADAVDSDELQLIEVKSYTANVASKNASDLTNTVFTFEAPTDGKHYVSYVVSDQRGGFATGIVEVATFDANQVARWTDIENGTLLFSAPQTKFESDISGDVYQSVFYDIYYKPALNIVTFNLLGAQSYCASRGRLPTTAEMEAMYNDMKPKDSLWPTSQSYYTQDGATAGLISLSNGATSALGGGLYYATCVDSGGLILSADKSVVVANGTNTSTISVTFRRDTAGPVTNEVLEISVTGSAIPSESTVTTNANGEASFTVSSFKAESTVISIDYTNLSSEVVSVSTTVNFIGDIDSASISSLVSETNNEKIDSSVGNRLRASVVDANGNPTEGVEVGVSVTGNGYLVQAPATLLTDDAGNVTFNIMNKTVETVSVVGSITSLLVGYTETSASSTFMSSAPPRTVSTRWSPDFRTIAVGKSGRFTHEYKYSDTPGWTDGITAGWKVYCEPLNEEASTSTKLVSFDGVTCVVEVTAPITSGATWINNFSSTNSTFTLMSK